MILQKEKIIIIGGGILGLSIARKFLKEGFKKITILERGLSVYFPNFKELFVDQLDF